jgi:hypothetical protein
MENPFAAWAPPDDDNPYRWISINQNGANGQVKAIENSLHNMCAEANQNIIWGKFSAGASMTQTPNDKGAMHHTLHDLFKTSNFRNEERRKPNTVFRKVSGSFQSSGILPTTICKFCPEKFLKTAGEEEKMAQKFRTHFPGGQGVSKLKLAQHVLNL